MTPARPGALSTPVAGLPAWLTCAGLLFIFAVPGQLLDLMGLGYMSSSGNALGKVHPGSDLIYLATLVAAIKCGNPLAYMGAQARRFPGAVALFMSTSLLLVYLIRVQEAPFTPFIDTFITPVFLLPILVDLPRVPRIVLERGLHCFLAFNAVLGLFEFATDSRVVPMSYDGLTITNAMDWRASGLLGHPLTSAGMAGLYSAILAMGFGPSMPSWLRAPAISLQVVSLGAFGGRTALVLTIGFLAVLLTLKTADLLRGRPFDRRKASLAVLFIIMGAVGAMILISAGFFDQLLARFIDDNGSAQSRALIFDVFQQLTPQEFWFGPDLQHLDSVIHLIGVESGVESFWFGFVVLCGLWMALLVFAGFGVFIWDVMRRADPRAFVPLFFFLAIVSTTVSLSVKSAWLTNFTTLVMVFMPRIERVTARALAETPRGWQPA